MRILLAILATLALIGCGSGKPSPFVGEWDSADTGASMRLSEGGDCRYFKIDGGGLVCEWESISKEEIRITMQRNGIFIEAEAKILLDELWLSTPSGGLDIFQKSS